MIAGIILAAGASPGQVTINGNLTLDSNDTLPIEINGTNAATDYDNFIVNGTVTLGDATLSLSGTHTPVSGQTFTIIDNDAADLVSGNFAGYAEGAVRTSSSSNNGFQVARRLRARFGARCARVDREGDFQGRKPKVRTMTRAPF